MWLKWLRTLAFCIGAFLGCTGLAEAACGLTESAPGGGRLSPVPGFNHGAIPLILVHGDHGDNESACGKWEALINRFSSAFAERYRLYVFIHDTSGSIGFDGKGNAQQLGEAIDRESSISKTEPIGFIAHSRGGLVVRAYMNLYKGGQGWRVFVLLTLGTPHHGSPGAVTDWGLYTLGHDWIDKRGCITNIFYNDQSPATYCGRFSGSVAVVVTRIGTTDLGWDNFDGDVAGIPSVSSFDVSGHLSSTAHVLSTRDANIEPPTSLSDTDVHQMEDNGSLSILNSSERFFDRIVAYGSYLLDPTKGDLLSNIPKFGADEHDRAYYAAQVMTTFSSPNDVIPQYAANDGLVPLQSSLLFVKPSNSEPIYRTQRKLLSKRSKIEFPLVIDEHAIVSRTAARIARVFADFDHYDLRDGIHNAQNIAPQIEEDINDGYELFGHPVISPPPPPPPHLPPTAGFSMTAGSQTALSGGTLNLVDRTQ